MRLAKSRIYTHRLVYFNSVLFWEAQSIDELVFAWHEKLFFSMLIAGTMSSVTHYAVSEAADIILAWHLPYPAAKLEFKQRGKDFSRPQLALKRLDQIIELSGLVSLQSFQNSSFVLWNGRLIE